MLTSPCCRTSGPGLGRLRRGPARSPARLADGGKPAGCPAVGQPGKSVGRPSCLASLRSEPATAHAGTRAINQQGSSGRRELCHAPSSSSPRSERAVPPLGTPRDYSVPLVVRVQIRELCADARGGDGRLPEVSQFRVGPTVKPSCIRTGPGGMGLVAPSCSLICSLNDGDWLDTVARTVRQYSNSGGGLGMACLILIRELPARSRGRVSLVSARCGYW